MRPYLPSVLAASAGAALGYAYYHFYGCTSG